MYLFEIIAISGDYDDLRPNAQIAKLIQFDVQHIKMTYGSFGPFIDTIHALEKAVFIILDGVDKQVPREAMPDENQQLFDENR